LLDIVLREETLINVVRSVTRNGRSIILTALLALILVYLFSIVGFLFLKDDFLVEAEPRMPRIVDSGIVMHEIHNYVLHWWVGCRDLHSP
jgi:hypothetical protein